MNISRIKDMIDNRIVEMINDGKELCVVQSELYNKANRFCEMLRTDKTLDLYKLLMSDEETISPVRTKYQVTYIKQCLKRIKDIDWLEDRREKFEQIDIKSEKKIFQLLKFKEKMSEENSLPF